MEGSYLEKMDSKISLRAEPQMSLKSGRRLHRIFSNV